LPHISTLNSWIRRLLFATAAVSGVLLLLRGVVGPFGPVNNPLNLESALALSVLLMLLTSRGTAEQAVQRNRRWSWAIVGIVAVVAYIPILSMPLVTDDYIHLHQISTGTAPTVLECLTRSCGGPQFFRPAGFATYWAEWKLSRTAAMPRHAFDLLLHAACSLLFLALLRRLATPPPFDWLGGLLFAMNGLGPESVAWPAARFDTLAVLFSLVAAIAVLRATRLAAATSLAATATACLSKESAYVLPVLLALLLGRSLWTRAGRLLAAGNFAVAGAIFAWRWWALKGIGGYVEQSGAPTVMQWDALKLMKTFLWRIWGVLWFPVNWSPPLEVWLMLGLAVGIAGSLTLFRARPDRTRLRLCALGVAVACIPVHHMLLIGPSLERSRYLTYATPAFVLLLVTACRGLPRWSGTAALSLIVAFQGAAQTHNLIIWRSVATARYDLCRSMAERARTTPGVLTIHDVPLVVSGVYWRNGLEECMALEFGIPLGKVLVKIAQPDPRQF
jgi:hypothetical protein